MSTDNDNRKLGDLRVIDLRAELEKRGFDKNGNKQALVERLQKALLDEGLNPEIHQFDLNDRKPKRLSTSSRDPPDNDEGQVDNDTTAEAENIENAEDENSTKVTASRKEKSNQIQESAKVNDGPKGQDQDQDEKAESPIQLTLEEEDGLPDNENENEAERDKAVTNTVKTDEKKSSNEASKNAKESSENNPSPQDVKKEEKSIGDSSDSKDTQKMKGLSDAQNRNLWITNISQNTRATELKQALSVYGKVIGAKVVINARYPGACCYGYVKMETVEDANNCITKLNNTELNGQIIRIEKVRPEHLNPNLNINKRIDNKEYTKPKSKALHAGKAEKDEKSKSESADDLKSDSKSDRTSEKKEKIDDGRKSELGNERIRSHKRSHSDDRRNRDKHRRRSRSGDRHDRSSSSKSRRREKDMLTFDKIKDERDRERIRERERLIREEKRRREEALRQREIERHQRSEAQRLEREREKLRIERDRLERERAELMQLERERQKLEREKLELEKMELERVKLRIQEEERRKRPAPYGRERSFEERKRVSGDRHFEEPPPPPRFDPPPSVKTREPSPSSKKFGSASKDFKSRLSFDKRESYPPKRDRNYESERSHPPSSIIVRPSQSMVKYDNSQVFNLNREREIRDLRTRENSGPVIPKYNSQVGKDARYTEHERDRSPHFRTVRDERDRRSIPEHKPEMRSTRDHRYSDPKGKEPTRFERSSGSWGHPSPTKGFTQSGSSAPPKTWGKESWRQSDLSGSADRWNSGAPSRGTTLSTTGFSNNSNIALGPTCPPPPAEYEANAQTNSIRNGTRPPISTPDDKAIGGPQAFPNPTNPHTVANNDGVWSCLSCRSATVPSQLDSPSPAKNHYTHMGEALYAELDQERTTDSNIPAYTDSDTPSAPSSAYYSDLSVTTMPDKTYQVVGPSTLPMSENGNSGDRRQPPRLASIRP